MRALADIPDDELRNLSEAGQRMRHEARLELEASNARSECACTPPSNFQPILRNNRHRFAEAREIGPHPSTDFHR
jgi:hypothetical protein